MTTNVTPMQHPAASEPHADLSLRQMRNAQAPARYDPYLVVHMHAEETQNNAVLWATYSDDELHAIVARLVASIPPATNAILARWMVAVSSPAERAALLRAARQTMPAAAFDAMLGALAQGLAPRDRVKLEAALA